MPITYTDATGKTLVAYLGQGVTAAQAAQAMCLDSDSWREISDAEAAELQKPTLEEARQARIVAIQTRLAELDFASVRPLRAIAQGEAIQEDRDKLTALDAEAEALRAELHTLQG